MASIGANGSRGHHRFTLNVNEISTNQANNTSTISWSLVLSSITTGYDWSYSGSVPVTYNISINGTNYSGNIMSYDGRSTVTVRSGTQTIGHNNDGTKSIGFSFSVSSINRSYLPGDCSSSGSMSLTRIPRQAIITSANNFTDEENPSFKFTNQGGYRMDVWLEPNPNGEHLCIRENIPNTGNYTWELTNEERNQLRQACSGSSCTVRIGVYTIISGTSHASYADKKMTIVNGNPIFEDFTYQDTNSNVTSITGNNQVLVKGVSTLQVNISSTNKMEALKYATANNYVASIADKAVSANYSNNNLSINVGTVNSLGVNTLNVRAYDSRNLSTLVSKEITIYDYSTPTINLEAKRLNNFENDTTLKVNGVFSTLNINNVDKNQITGVNYRYREVGNNTWSSYQSINFTITNDAYTCSDVVIDLDNTKEFEIEVQVIDELITTTQNIKVDIGVPIFFISTTEEKCYVKNKRVLTEDDTSIITDCLKTLTGYDATRTQILKNVNGTLTWINQ